MELEVEKKLKNDGIFYKIIPLGKEAYTVADVIEFTKGAVKPEEICKTIIVKTRASSSLYAFLLRGNDKLHFTKVKKLFKEDVSVANAEEVKRASGVEPGAVCPFLLSVPLYVDKMVLNLENIHCGSGHHLYGLEFKSTDLIKGINYAVVDVIKENS